MTKKINNKKVCYSINGAVDATDYSRTYLYDAIKRKELKTYMRGNRRFIIHNDLVEFIHRQAGEV